MPRFGSRSRKNLATCDEDLQDLFNEVIKYVDCSVICGHRNKEDQDKAFKEKRTKVKFPNGRHNSNPSRAVDVVPYPIDWDNLQRFKELSEVIKTACETVGVDNLYWGFDLWQWDMPHWELRNEPVSF